MSRRAKGSQIFRGSRWPSRLFRGCGHSEAKKPGSLVCTADRWRITVYTWIKTGDGYPTLGRSKLTRLFLEFQDRRRMTTGRFAT